MSRLPDEALERLRETLASRPAVRRARLDGTHFVLELDEVAAGIDDYRAEIQEYVALIANALGAAGQGLSLSCGPTEVIARLPSSGVVVYERAGT